jgi:hypothetical protein
LRASNCVEVLLTVDARGYPQECDGVSARDVDEERRSVLIHSHWRLLSNIRRSLMVSPLEILVESNELCRCYFTVEDYGMPCGA